MTERQDQTPIFMPNDASPEAYKLLKAMMDVTTAYAPERGRLGETHILAACATR